MSPSTLAKLACAYSGLAWGTFWIPLRVLEQKGIAGVWANLLFYIVPFVLILPVLLWRWRKSFTNFRPALLGGTMAVCLVLYSMAMLNTEVVKAMLLFYLTPLWSTLMTRVIFGERITLVRWLSLAAGFLGALVVLKSEGTLPWPANIGDWMALASGVLWSVTSILFRIDDGRTHPLELWTQNFLWSAVVAVLIVMLFRVPFSEMPPVSAMVAELWWLVPTIIVMVMTGIYAATWGTPKLDPGIVGLLFMTEISVGSITAALWANEPFGLREILGILLITGAGILESVVDLWRVRRAKVA